MFPKTVRTRQAAGIVGEFAVQGPQEVAPFEPGNFAADTPRIVGRIYTYNAAGAVVLGIDPAAAADDVVPLAGLLVSPKEYVAIGHGLGVEFDDVAVDPVEFPIGRVRDDQTVQLCIKGEVWVNNTSTPIAPINGTEQVAVVRTTGELATFAQGAAIPATHYLLPNARTWRSSGQPHPGANPDPTGSVFIVKLNG